MKSINNSVQINGVIDKPSQVNHNITMSKSTAMNITFTFNCNVTKRYVARLRNYCDLEYIQHQ